MISMKNIIYMLMLTAVVSCGTARHIQPEQNSADQDMVDVGFGQVSRNNLAFRFPKSR